MKKWFEYQMQHQVVDRDWSKYLVPVANISGSIHKIFAKIKQNYRDGNYEEISERIFTSRGYVKDAGDSNVTANQIYDWIHDPEFLHFINLNGITRLVLPDNEIKLLRTVVANKMDLSVENTEVFVFLQKPGQYVAMHVDKVRNGYGGLAPESLDSESRHIRGLIFFDDWKDGQVFQVGEDFIKWKAGDVFTWAPRDVPHGSANFGYDDRFLLLVTGIPTKIIESRKST